MLHLNLLDTAIPSEIGNLNLLGKRGCIQPCRICLGVLTDVIAEKFVFGSGGMNRTAVGTIPTEIGLLSSLSRSTCPVYFAVRLGSKANSENVTISSGTFDLTLNGAVGEIPSQLGNATSLGSCLSKVSFDGRMEELTFPLKRRLTFTATVLLEKSPQNLGG